VHEAHLVDDLVARTADEERADDDDVAGFVDVDVGHAEGERVRELREALQHFGLVHFMAVADDAGEVVGVERAERGGIVLANGLRALRLQVENIRSAVQRESEE
jgi:hypothetical protein